MNDDSSIEERVGLYLVDRDPGDEDDGIRARLAPNLKKGERVVDGKLLYSAAWIDDEGEHHAL